jgi:hypothetical protein
VAPARAPVAPALTVMFNMVVFKKSNKLIILLLFMHTVLTTIFVTQNQKKKECQTLC